MLAVEWMMGLPILKRDHDVLGVVSEGIAPRVHGGSRRLPLTADRRGLQGQGDHAQAHLPTCPLRRCETEVRDRLRTTIGVVMGSRFDGRTRALHCLDVRCGPCQLSLPTFLRVHCAVGALWSDDGLQA